MKPQDDSFAAVARVILWTTWFALLIPYLVLLPLAGMAFDAGPGLVPNVFFWSWLTYPVSLAVGFLLRRKTSWLILLPMVNLAGVFTSGLKY